MFCVNFYSCELLLVTSLREQSLKTNPNSLQEFMSYIKVLMHQSNIITYVAMLISEPFSRTHAFDTRTALLDGLSKHYSEVIFYHNILKMTRTTIIAVIRDLTSVIQ